MALTKNKTAAVEGGREIKQAVRASLQRLLNAYLRESSGLDLERKAPAGRSPMFVQNGSGFLLYLPKTGRWIFGEMTYTSADGFHTYGPYFYESGEKDPRSWKKEEAGRIIDVVLDELAAHENDPEAAQYKRDTLSDAIRNSVEKTAWFIRRFLERKEGQRSPYPFQESEQSLVFGHPFHPAPKSSEGFTFQDVKAYAPEFGVSFQLHYWALSPEWVGDEDVGGDGLDPWIPDTVRTAAREELGSDRQYYKLLPLHPWQSEMLLRQEDVREWLHQGTCVNLGPLGDDVYPTSSVRTVWEPNHGCFYKLPLNVRMTNFFRTNTREQIDRTLDAARVVRRVKEEFQPPSFYVLDEYGCRRVRVPSVSPQQQDAWMENLSVIFRENPENAREMHAPPRVVASLLEKHPDGGEPTLIREMCQHPLHQGRDFRYGFEQYLHLSMLPILYYFTEKGVGLEAHAQNTLLRLEQGRPTAVYVRDLEGISIDREQARKNGWIGSCIGEDSPVLYTEEDTWRRLNYYYFVNHLMHVVHILARYGEKGEAAYWNVVKRVLAEECRGTSSLRMKRYTRCLLEDPWWAKANLFSFFQGRGDQPSYVTIQNPMESGVG